MTEDILVIPKVGCLTIHSGNIVNWNRLKRKPNQSSTEELSECIKATLQDCIASKDKNELQTVSDLDCPHSKFMEALPKDERGDLKITLKLFLCRLLPPESIKEAINNVLTELDVTFLETVLISFPEFEDDEMTLDVIQPYWKILEQLVEEEVVLSIGISDLDKILLERLFDWAQVKPCINQVNLESCCVMPKDLTEYAKQNDIQLLTHNDSKDIFTDKNIQNLISSICTEKDGENWEMQWVARYSVLVKCRGIIKTKAYLAYATRNLRWKPS